MNNCNKSRKKAKREILTTQMEEIDVFFTRYSFLNLNFEVEVKWKL